jgi:hypothetical protein
VFRNRKIPFPVECNPMKLGSARQQRAHLSAKTWFAAGAAQKIVVVTNLDPSRTVKIKGRGANGSSLPEGVSISVAGMNRFGRARNGFRPWH